MTQTTHDAEGTAEEVKPEAEPFHTAEVVPAPQQPGILMPYDAGEVSDAMRAYQEVLRASLDPSDWQGTPGQRGSFVKKSGWRKIAKAFGLSVTMVDAGVERDDEGNPVRAWAVYRAAHPNGQEQDGDGYCSVDESRFSSAKGRHKIENDLRTTAATRAKNRAISDLVGMGEVSAEEIATASFAPAPFKGDLPAAMEALTPIIGGQTVSELSDWIAQDNDGTVPASTGRAIVAICRAIAAASPEKTDTEIPF
jgi:hypothetical protein